MSAHGDGGSAFPCMPPQDATARRAEEYPYPDPGMTLRDYLAVNATVAREDDGHIWPPLAVLVMGSAQPTMATVGDSDAGRLVALSWWFEAEARLRYLKADAMLKARQA